MATEERMQARIDELTTEAERLTGCLKRANAGMESVERDLYLKLQEQEAEVERLRAALTPFVVEAMQRSWITNLSAASGLDDMNIGGSGLTNGDLRRAFDALNPPKPAE